MTQGILGVSRGFECSSYGTTVASCRDRGNPRHLPCEEVGVYWCEFRRGPRVAPSETLYNLRRCYPKPMPCAARDARPSTAPPPLSRRHGGGEGGGGESGATAEPRSAARAAVAHPARLPEPKGLPHTRPTHTAEPPTRVGPSNTPPIVFKTLSDSAKIRRCTIPAQPSYPHSSTPHTRGARRFGAGLGHTPEREKRERAREKRRERENDGR